MVARMDPGSGEGAIKRFKQQASDVTERVRDEAKSLKDQIAEKVGQVTELVQDEATRLVDEQKSKAAEKIEKVGSVMRKSAGILQGAKIGGVAQYVDMAASATEQASKYIENTDLSQMAEDVSHAIRQHPLAIFGGVLLAGIAVGRFIKAGEQAESE